MMKVKSRMVNVEISTRYQSIQLLRAVAALIVVVFHSKSAFGPEDRLTLWWWPGISDHGAMGVSLFFVISGFIIAHTLDQNNRNSNKNHKINVANFVWRRIFRIYPLYIIVMSAGLATFAWRGWFKGDIEALGLSGMIASFLIVPMKPFPFWNPGWTIEHELLFYLIAALVTPLFGLYFLALLMVSLGIIGFWVTFWDFHLFTDAQFYFGAGIVAYLTRHTNLPVAAMIAMLLLSVAYAHLYGFFGFPYQFRSLAFAFGFAALIVACMQLEARGWRVPRLAVAIGDASYSLYLWHWLMIPFTGLAHWTYGGAPEFWRWILVTSSVLVALISYRIIERPINNWARK